VVTKAFLSGARVQAKLLGMPELALAVVGHPFAAQNLEVTYSRADEAAPQIIDLLSPKKRRASTA
jgi:hypothetical protein